jgi:hypothetical protein
VRERIVAMHDAGGKAVPGGEPEGGYPVSSKRKSIASSMTVAGGRQPYINLPALMAC